MAACPETKAFSVIYYNYEEKKITHACGVFDSFSLNGSKSVDNGTAKK